jgi:hypothetical protein
LTASGCLADPAWFCAPTSAAGAFRKNLAKAISYLYNPENIAQSEIVLSLTDDHPAAELFAYWRQVIELDSPAATAARGLWREHVEQRERMARQRTAGEERDEWVDPRISDDAQKAKAGDT